MNASPSVPYQPGDVLYLWWLANPAAPRLVGELRLARMLRGVSLVYAPDWLQTGFALSEDLPLRPGEYFPQDKDCAAGAVDDARPDRWGERIVRLLDKPPRLAVLDFLYFAGDERFGALGVSVSAERYQGHSTGPLPVLADVADMDRLVQQVLAGEPVAEAQRRLITPGATLGGARPKALLHLEGAPWVLKFNEPGEMIDMPLIEHATMTLAAQAGINVAQTRALPLPRGHALAVKRFDRTAHGGRCHVLSANVILKAAGEALGYPELAQWLRRRGVTTNGLHRAQMQELFRRMVFNILMDNTDDHEKNHAVRMTDSGEFALAPAFDVLPAGQALGFQQMRVGTQGADATLENALSACGQFGLRPREARAEVQRVCAVVAGWQTHFSHIGVRPANIEQLAQQIDRPFLREQRQDGL